MNYLVCCLLLFVLTLPVQLPQSGASAVPKLASTSAAARHFDRIRGEPPALRAFLRALPKGADLHTHLSGAIYAETYIRWAAELPLCIDVSDFSFVDASEPPAGRSAGAPDTPCKDPARQRPAWQALQDPLLYRNVVDALSVRNWDQARSAGHYQFFDAFRKFDTVIRRDREDFARLVGRGIAEVLHRAALQNVLHLELMISFGAGVNIGDERSWEAEHLRTLHERMMTSGLERRVAEQRRWLDAVDAEARAVLGCGTPAAIAGCEVSVRFIAYALRGLPPNEVYSQAVLAFAMAAVDPRVAGVNLVMPEDWHIPMRDHDLHMRMFAFLGKVYPDVNVALHAGELSLGIVPPEKLGLHVRQAIEIGGARRIGHATDVMNDVDPAALLREMARRRIAVEISLSSSDVILGIRGARHPLRQFLRAGVPVVIATDDEGVARSDLTNEYQRAVEEHTLSYRELQDISRNSIEHSFLPSAEKARLRRRLDAAVADFEARFR